MLLFLYKGAPMDRMGVLEWLGQWNGMNFRIHGAEPEGCQICMSLSLSWVLKGDYEPFGRS
jgi:hypothetical protein